MQMVALLQPELEAARKVLLCRSVRQFAKRCLCGRPWEFSKSQRRGDCGASRSCEWDRVTVAQSRDLHELSHSVTSTPISLSRLGGLNSEFRPTAKDGRRQHDKALLGGGLHRSELFFSFMNYKCIPFFAFHNTHPLPPVS
jgi:hypothetical protein